MQMLDFRFIIAPLIMFALKAQIANIFLLDYGSAIIINDLDLDKINATISELNDPEKFKSMIFPQPEEVYRAFNIPRFDEVLSRKKRIVTVNFPPQSLFVIDAYINIPLPTVSHVFAPLTLQSRSFFFMPNLTLGSLGSISRNLNERLHLYEIAETFFKTFGYDGKACVLRAICERSELHVVTDGILGELITLILEFSSPSGDLTYKDYEIAREHGRSEGNCFGKYSSCSLSIFSWL